MSENTCDTSYVLIDWGTSSFRFWCISASNKVVYETQEPIGMSKLSPFDYEPFLEKNLSNLNISINVPVLICGMAGAAQGWQEAKYIDLPTRLHDIFIHAVSVKTKSNRDVRILPGLAQRMKSSPDVIRGEETILLGALVNNFTYENYCMPGTHSKQVRVMDGEVYQFQTFMTGEIFALFTEYSTLSYFMNIEETKLHEHDAFCNAVIEISKNPGLLPNKLFSIRSGSLLFPDEDYMASKARLSGLLIGAELAAMQPEQNNKIGLIAQGALADNYASAMRCLDMDYDVIDSNVLALSGLMFAANKIWSN